MFLNSVTGPFKKPLYYKYTLLIVIHYSQTTHQMQFPIILKVTKFSSQRNKGKENQNQTFSVRGGFCSTSLFKSLRWEFNLCHYKPYLTQNIVQTIPNLLCFSPNSIELFGWETEKKSFLPHFLVRDFREKLLKNQLWNYMIILGDSSTNIETCVGWDKWLQMGLCMLLFK